MDAAKKGFAESSEMIEIKAAAEKGIADAHKNMDVAKNGLAESIEIKAAAEKGFAKLS